MKYRLESLILSSLEYIPLVDHNQLMPSILRTCVQNLCNIHLWSSFLFATMQAISYPSLDQLL